MRPSRRELLAALPGAALGPSLRAPSWRVPETVLLITTDQHSGRALAAAPAMRALGETGASFAASWCADPSCSPARAAWVLGRPGSETGVVLNRLPAEPGGPELGRWLRDGGVETVLIGKWHVPGLSTTGWSTPSFEAPSAEQGDLLQLRAARRALRERAGRAPLLLWVSLVGPHDVCQATMLETLHPGDPDGPHSPVEADLPPPPPNLGDRGGEAALFRKVKRHLPAETWTAARWRRLRGAYDRMVGAVDAVVAELLAEVEAAGMDETTTVIVTSDHGDNLGEHGLAFKESPYEAALSVPFVIAAPGRLPARGRDHRLLLSGLDLFPTLTDLFGLPTPPGLPGRSVRARLLGEEPDHEFIVGETLVEGRMVRDRRHKLVLFRGEAEGQLFDLEADPYERRNLWGASEAAGPQADLLRALRAFEARGRPHRRSQAGYEAAFAESRREPARPAEIEESA